MLEIRNLIDELNKYRNAYYKLHSATDNGSMLPVCETFEKSFDFMCSLGFTVVSHHIGDASSCTRYFDELKDYCKILGLPIDGLVGSFNNIAYGQSLGMTSHHPKHSLAFKFYQEPNETTLLDIEWSVSRTGMINPVAILEPVEIDGTTVSRASLSNVSIIKELELGLGDTVTLIKANQIIPKVMDNLTRSNSYEVPGKCPCCGADAVIKSDYGREVLYCPNEECHDRVVDNLVNFCGKNGMDIVGLSVETINTLVELGYILKFADIYDLQSHQKSLEQIDRFGKSKVAKLLAAIEKSRNQRFENVIVAIGIPGIGKSAAKQIAAHCASLAVHGDNMDVWNSIREDTTMIFQWESQSATAYLKQLFSDETVARIKEKNPNFSYMDLLSIGNGAIRPAGESYRDNLAQGIYQTYGNAALDEFMKPTLGYCVYQEQLIEFMHKFCGFTMGEADVVRRHFSKKTGTEKDIPIIKDGGYISETSTHYIKGFIQTMKEAYGMDKEDAEKLIGIFVQIFIDASDYLFSKNHADPYSWIGYICGYLRYHYPLEFITTALNIFENKEEKSLAIIDYAKRQGIHISPIKFRHSIAQYNFDKETNEIFKGISSIKLLWV